MILNEKYRPTSIEECILPKHIKDGFRSMVQKGEMQHLLLSGDKGMGKTSVAIALCNDLESEYILINASLHNGIDTLRTTILDFASTMSIDGNMKTIIMDEADRLSASAQDGLRGFIEEFSSNCKFIMTANFPNRISSPLRESRLIEIEFKISEEERPDIQKQMFVRCMDILGKEEITFKKDILATLIKRYYPDMRRIINTMQYHSRSGVLEITSLSDSDEEQVAYIKRVIKSNDFVRIREWANDNSKADHSILLQNIYSVAGEIFNGQALSASIVMISDYQDKLYRAVNPEITLAALMVELGQLT